MLTSHMLHYAKDDDGDDHDEILIDSVVELMSSLAKLYGPEFAEPLASLMPGLLGYCRSAAPA
eukprot:SAG11_NODE_5634_length_1501_cov_1.169757_3_plen_62_part_01